MDTNTNYSIKTTDPRISPITRYDESGRPLYVAGMDYLGNVTETYNPTVYGGVEGFVGYDYNYRELYDAGTDAYGNRLYTNQFPFEGSPLRQPGRMHTTEFPAHRVPQPTNLAQSSTIVTVGQSISPEQLQNANAMKDVTFSPDAITLGGSSPRYAGPSIEDDQSHRDLTDILEHEMMTIPAFEEMEYTQSESNKEPSLYHQSDMKKQVATPHKEAINYRDSKTQEQVSTDSNRAMGDEPKPDGIERQHGSGAIGEPPQLIESTPINRSALHGENMPVSAFEPSNDVDGFRVGQRDQHVSFIDNEDPVADDDAFSDDITPDPRDADDFDYNPKNSRRRRNSKRSAVANSSIDKSSSNAPTPVISGLKGGKRITKNSTMGRS